MERKQRLPSMTPSWRNLLFRQGEDGLRTIRLTLKVAIGVGALVVVAIVCIVVTTLVTSLSKSSNKEYSAPSMSHTLAYVTRA